MSASEIRQKFKSAKLGEKVRRVRSWVYKGALVFLLSSTALSTILHFCPNATSQSFDDFMKSKGFDDNLSAHFHAADIRVYKRDNPLVIWRMAGDQVVENIWHRSLLDEQGHAGKSPGAGAIAYKSAVSVIAYPVALFSRLWASMNAMPPLDVNTVRGSDAFESRNVFIYPLADASAEEYIKSFIPLLIRAPLHFKNDPEEIRKAFFQYVMLHEARHGDQDNHLLEMDNPFFPVRTGGAKEVSESTNESDADVYAFQVLRARGVNSAVLDELLEIMTHVRRLGEVIGYQSDHTTSLALARGGQNLLEGITDKRDFESLYRALDQAYRLNKDKFTSAGVGAVSPEGIKRKSLIHLALMADERELFKNDPALDKACKAFIESARYVNSISENSLYKPGFDTSGIDLDFLLQEYKPVPDKLQASPQKAPVPKA